MRGNLPLAPRWFPPPLLMGRRTANEPLRVVPRPRERNRRVRAADDRGRTRPDALRPGEAAQLAALRGRGRPPLRRPAHRHVRLAARADTVRRLVRAVFADAVGCPGHLELPAALDRTGRRRRGAAARAGDHQPLPETALVPVLAPRALSELRRLGAGALPRDVRGHRSGGPLGRRALRLFGRRGRGLDRVARDRRGGGVGGPHPPPPPPTAPAGGPRPPGGAPPLRGEGRTPPR